MRTGRRFSARDDLRDVRRIALRLVLLIFLLKAARILPDITRTTPRPLRRWRFVAHRFAGGNVAVISAAFASASASGNPFVIPGR